MHGGQAISGPKRRDLREMSAGTPREWGPTSSLFSATRPKHQLSTGPVLIVLLLPKPLF
jgi:hypothetical protein